MQIGAKELIKVKMYNVMAAKDIFMRILSSNFTGRQAFILSRALKEIDKEIVDFNKAKDFILLKYAEKDENDNTVMNDKNTVKIAEDKYNDVNNELQELLYTEIEINMEPIPLEWLDNLQFTPKEMIDLEPFIKI